MDCSGEITSGMVSVCNTPFSTALSLVRQPGHMHCVSLRSFLKKLTYFPREGRLGSPYSALCLVQQRIHALRQSTAAWDFHGVGSGAR